MRPCILILSILILTACSKQDRIFNNPFDSNYPEDLWKPSGLTVTINNNTNITVVWTQSEQHIDGFLLTQNADGVITTFSIAPSARAHTLPAPPIGTCATLKYALQAVAGNNKTTAIETVPIKFPTAPVANGGSDLVNGLSGQTQYTLNALPLKQGETGKWSIVSGGAGTFGSETSPTTVFTGTGCTTYLVLWTVKIACVTATDDVLVNFKTPFSEVAVATQEPVVRAASFQLNAQPPSSGVSGIWSITSGAGGTIQNPSSPTSQFSGIIGNQYGLVWTVTDGCSSASTAVTVTLKEAPVIDGRTYLLTTIGSQTWFAEDLNTTVYANGDPILQVTDNIGWSGTSSGAWCYYDDLGYHGSVKLYNGFAVRDPRGVCPAGFHVPSQSDWTLLITQLFGAEFAGGRMKSTEGWFFPNQGATANNSFAAKGGGFRLSDGSFRGYYTQGRWWSATEVNPGQAVNQIYGISLSYDQITVGTVTEDKASGFSVRCVSN